MCDKLKEVSRDGVRRPSGRLFDVLMLVFGVNSAKLFDVNVVDNMRTEHVFFFFFLLQISIF